MREQPGLGELPRSLGGPSQAMPINCTLSFSVLHTSLLTVQVWLENCSGKSISEAETPMLVGWIDEAFRSR